jgi:L-lactate dehydrogenase complex protein LldE
MRVSLMVTCVVDLFTPEVGVATVQVLRAIGAEVSCPSGQTCCGQPAWNSGFTAEAAEVARTTLAALEADSSDTVVVPAGSCATMIRQFWPELFDLVGDHDAAARATALGERVMEFSEFVATQELPPMVGGAEPIAYHHSCHMLRELRIETQPLEALASAGVTVVPWSAAARCCGFGGLFSFKLPEASVAMADDKLSSLTDTEARTVVGCDSSCLLHLRARAEHEGRPIATRHLAEVLAEAIEAARR